MLFPVMPDNIQTVTTVFNNKVSSISAKNFSVDYARIDILDENISQINSIIDKTKKGLEGFGDDPGGIWGRSLNPS